MSSRGPRKRVIPLCRVIRVPAMLLLITLFSTMEAPAADSHRPPSFRTDIAPLLSKAGCNMGACHGNLNGKGGFKLSLRGEDPSFDYQTLTHDQSGRRVSRLAPRTSLIVLKPTGAVPHEGGLRFAHDSIEAQTLLAWIAAGASDDRVSAPRVKELRILPAERILVPGALDQHLVVTAFFDDGTTRDVSRQAAYDVSDPTRVEVSIDGQVHARGPCETAIAVRYMNGRTTSRLAFLADRPGFVWRGEEPSGAIDSLVFAKLKALRMNPSPLCTDSVFLRRAFLDAIGRLPDPAEARAFLESTDPDKRDKLIDRLVERPEFADFWALKWADLLRNEEKTMGEKGSWVLQRWLRDQLARDIPLDAMVRQIVTGLGSTWQNPPASFHRTNRDPTAAAESVGQVFLGIRLQCARCHNHPFDVWTQNDYYGLAAFFANVARKQPSDGPERSSRPARDQWRRIHLPLGPPRDGSTAHRIHVAAEVPERTDDRSPGADNANALERAGRLADARKIPSSAGTWPIGSGSTCSGEASSTRSTISASQIRRQTPPSWPR